MEIARCGICEWSVTEEESTDLSRDMIDHFAETDHSPIVREPATDASSGERVRTVE